MSKMWQAIRLPTGCLVLGVFGMLGVLAGCASKSASPEGQTESEKAERNFNAPSLQVTQASTARQVLEAVPLESMMERFAAFDAQGRLIAYVAFTDTETGGLVFIDGKLQGSVSKRDAQAFYVCRGYSIVTPERYWSAHATAWLESLLTRVRPENSVNLEFSGKSVTQSIKEARKNPLFDKLRAFIGMGSNPLKVFDTLNTAHSDYEASERYDVESAALSLITPGMNEQRLARIAAPTDLAFSSGGMVMGYPEHRVEYFVQDGIIRVIQQPSFHMLFRTRTAKFYAAGVNWSACTPQQWMRALPAEGAEVGAEVPAKGAVLASPPVNMPTPPPPSDQGEALSLPATKPVSPVVQ